MKTRTTIALADDAFLFAKQFAAKERVSLGEAVSRLVRAGAKSAVATANDSRRQKFKGPHSLLASRGALVTSAHVRALMDELGV